MRFRFAVMVVVVLAGGAGWWWFHRQPAVSVPTTVAAPVAVRVLTVAEGEVTTWAAVIGSLVARNEVRVAAEGASGRIIALAADVGDQVSAGQVVVRLDPVTAEIQLAQARASRQRALAAVGQQQALQREAAAAQAEAEAAVRRVETAGATIISDEVRNQRVTAAATAAARTQAAQQAIALAEADVVQSTAQERQAEENLARTSLHAPTAGVVLDRSARLGAVVNPGETLLTLLQDGVVEYAAEITEELIPALRLGQEVEVTAAGVTGKGTIRRLDPAVDPLTRLGQIRISLATTPAWRPGLSARGRILLAKGSGPFVPRSALLEDERGAAVLVVTDGHAHRRPVGKLLRGETQILVGEGLRAGEVIVSTAPNFIPDGEAVTPVAEAPAAGTPRVETAP